MLPQEAKPEDEEQMDPNDKPLSEIDKSVDRKPSLLRQIWSTTTRPLRLVAATIAAFGLIFLLLGIIGDIKDWFSSLPFITNILSGITTACFGIPLALVFLQWLTSLQGEELRKRSVMRLRVKLSTEFKSSIYGPVRSGKPDDLKSLLSEYARVNQVWEELGEAAAAIIRSTPDEYYSNNVHPESVATKKYRLLLGNFSKELQVASRITREVLEPQPENWTIRAGTQWETLESSLRNESLRAGLDWISAGLEVKIESLIKDIRIPELYSIWDVSNTVQRYTKTLGGPLTNMLITEIQAGGFTPGVATVEIRQLHELMVNSEEVVQRLSGDY